MKKLVTGLLPLLCLLSSCGNASDFPFEVDTDQGIFRIVIDQYATGPWTPEVNGSRVLEGAFLFRKEDSLVAVSSSGRLDVISVFRGGHKSCSLQLSVVNPDKGVLEISDVRLFNIILDGSTSVAECSGRSVKLSGRSDLSVEISRQIPDGGLWDCIIEPQETSVSCSLALSGSSIVLLPGERVDLPIVNFFCHL